MDDAAEIRSRMYIDFGWIAQEDQNVSFRPFFDLAQALITLMNVGEHSLEYTAIRIAEIREHMEKLKKQKTQGL